jgi:lipid A ethanolaminephosphotransferase
LGASYAGQTRAPLLVLVVGETARAANVSLGGYGHDSGRDTTPALRALQARGLAPQGQKEGQLHYFSQVTSCGTNTQASVPCMFSHHGKEGHESQSGSFDNLLDVLQRAGLAVLWLDNQSGCKGVCDRVTHINTREHTDARYCTDGECLDEVMLSVLDAQLAALPPQRTAQGVVVVLHQMGSHGPAYHKRSPPAHKAFMPECTSNALPDCSHQELINAYDNSLRYTDHFLSQTVQWLQRQPVQGAMLYVSDHGESLGEHNLYLHGLPYALAPQVQKHVPMVTWLSESVQQRLRLNTTCLSQRTAEPLSHDHLFHSVLGLMDVQTQAYRAELDALAPCRGAATAPLTPSSPLIRG